MVSFYFPLKELLIVVLIAMDLDSRGRSILALPIRRWTPGRRAMPFRRRFLILFYFSSYEEKTMKQTIS